MTIEIYHGHIYILIPKGKFTKIFLEAYYTVV